MSDPRGTLGTGPFDRDVGTNNRVAPRPRPPKSACRLSSKRCWRPLALRWAQTRTKRRRGRDSQGIRFVPESANRRWYSYHATPTSRSSQRREEYSGSSRGGQRGKLANEACRLYGDVVESCVARLL